MATLSIDLDDNASDALANVDAALDQMAATSVDAAKKADVLTKSQSQSITVTQKQTLGFSVLANTSIKTFGSMAETAARCFTEIELSAMKHLANTEQLLIKTGGSIIKFGIVAAGAVGVANAAFNKHKKSVKESSDATDDAAESQGHFLETAAGVAVGLTGLGFAIGQTTAGYSMMGKAANLAGKSAVNAFTGFGPYVAGATLGLKGYMAVLDATGHKYSEMKEVVTGATQEQITAFREFQKEARDLDTTITQLAVERGKDIGKFFKETFGQEMVQYASNLERVQQAMGGLRGEIMQTINETGQAQKDWWESWEWPDAVKAGWKSFDESMTRTTDATVQNIGIIKSTFRTGVDQLSDSWSVFIGDNVRATRMLQENVSAMQKLVDSGASASEYRARSGAEMERQQADSMKKLGELNERNGLGFERVAELRKKFGENDAKRAEDARIASLKTVESIDAESEALKGKITQLAMEGKLNGAKETKKGKDGKETQVETQAYKDSIKRLEELEKAHETLASRRAAVEKDTAEAAKKNARDVDEWNKKQIADERKAIDEKMKGQKELYELEAKQAAGRMGMQLELRSLSRKEDASSGLSAAKEMLAVQKEITAEKMRAAGSENFEKGAGGIDPKDRDAERAKALAATETQVKQQLAAMDKQFSEAEHSGKMVQIDEEAKAKLGALERERMNLNKNETDDTKRAKEMIRLQGEWDKAHFDREKAMIAENGKFQRDQDKMALDAKLANQQALFAAERERIQKIHALSDEQNGKLKEQFDPKAFGQAQDQGKVKKQFMDNAAAKAKQDQMDRDQDLGEDAQNGDKQAFQKFKANQQRQMAAARRKAAQDFDNGDAPDGDVQKAQNQVGQQTLQGMAKQGKLNDGQTQVLTDALKTLADQQQAIDNNTVTVQNMINFMKGVKTTARASVTATQNQQGSLN